MLNEAAINHVYLAKGSTDLRNYWKFFLMDNSLKKPGKTAKFLFNSSHNIPYRAYLIKSGENVWNKHLVG